MEKRNNVNNVTQTELVTLISDQIGLSVRQVWTGHWCLMAVSSRMCRNLLTLAWTGHWCLMAVSSRMCRNLLTLAWTDQRLCWFGMTASILPVLVPCWSWQKLTKAGTFCWESGIVSDTDLYFSTNISSLMRSCCYQFLICLKNHKYLTFLAMRRPS